MDETVRLNLPFMLASQAGKHITHNEALLRLDTLVHLAVLDADRTAPPAGPAPGARHLVAAGATGGWAGADAGIAAWQDGGWVVLAPRPGWRAYDLAAGRLLVFDGGDWVACGVPSVNPAPLVGVNTTADTGNRLAVASPASLFSHAGDDHRLKINKAATGDSAAVLFQTGYSGRAELGLAGDDHWRVRVSADGAAWNEGLRIEAGSGRVLLPAGLALSDPDQAVAARHVRDLLIADRTYFVRSDGSDSNDGLADSAGGALLTIQKAVDIVAGLDLGTHDVTIQVGAGTWTAAVVLRTLVGAGQVTLRGDPVTPSNVQLSRAPGVCIEAQNIVGRWHVDGFKLAASGTGSSNGRCINLIGPTTTISYENIEFGTAQVSHLHVQQGAYARQAGPCSISGGAQRHAHAVATAVVETLSTTLTITASVSFGSAFFDASNLGHCRSSGMTFVNPSNVTGKRYSVVGNAVVTTGLAGPSYFPGTIDGTVESGGQYL